MPCFADAEAASEDAAALPQAADPAFLHALHVRYFAAHLRRLPPPYTAMESSRMTCVYFCVVALDVLGALDDAAVLPPERRASIVEWVLARSSTRMRTAGSWAARSWALRRQASTGAATAP